MTLLVHWATVQCLLYLLVDSDILLIDVPYLLEWTMAGGLIDPNLSYAWTNQQVGSSSNLYGQAGLGYGTNAPTAAATVAFGTAPNVGQGGGLALAGTGPYIGTGPYGVSGNANAQALTNAGYADGNGTFLGQLSGTTQPAAPTLVAATRVNNPSGLAALVTLVGTTGNVYVGPVGVAGSGTTNLTLVGAAAGTYTVPPGGVIYVTTVSGVTATWITQN
jgi:hypothetical protein